MRFSAPAWQEVTAFAALLILGGLAGDMLYVKIPSENATSLTFVLGALSGALTVGGGSRVAASLHATATGTPPS